MFLNRILNLASLLAKKSFFLLGPRATGKSSLIQQQLSERSLIINLLRNDVYLQLNEAPWLLESLISVRHNYQDIVVIDEVQKIP